MMRVAGALGAILATAAMCSIAACGTITPAAPPAPANSCPENPCDGYDGGRHVHCVQGACIADADASTDDGASPTGDIVLLVTTAADAPCAPGQSAPGQTWAVTYDALRREPDAGVLPVLYRQTGGYRISSTVANNEVQWSLGASLDNQVVNLPIHATLQPLSLDDPDGSSIDVRSLPIPPVQACPQPDLEPDGPGGSQSISYNAPYLQEGLYLRSMAPDPPFDQAFGPEIKRIEIPTADDYTPIKGYQTVNSSSIGIGSALPAVAITRDRGTFDGWKAYLRDTTTGTAISNMAPLSGSSTQVTFAVYRVTPLPDGGTNSDPYLSAELVVAPPDGSVEPTYIGTILNDFLAPRASYPTLPPPVLVHGAILASLGAPVPADLVFEASAITTIVNGSPQDDSTSFELTRWASVGPDGSYSVYLPPGTYRFDIRPKDTHPLLVRDLHVPVQYDPLLVDESLGTMTKATVTVAVADGRPLDDAVVEALPVQCALPPDAGMPKNSTFCMPRPARPTTADGGVFFFELDPGQYTLRAEPPPGSRLPWMSTGPINVTSTTATDAGTVFIPVPLSLGMVLRDPAGNPVGSALVRAFRTSSQGGSVELGMAVTDDKGRYELYVAP
ncbi:MAG: hypothetical protein FWD17_03525 [Polyangiaceae bacterium]|nr:hypothetical protein [Polyangiaceae bacterium]